MITPNKKPPEIQTKTLRLDDFSMGLNTTISGSLLNNNELQVAEDVSFEQKGTIMPRRGRRKRYEEEFSDSPCCGLGSYYKKDGTTKLLFASGDKLYSDSPSISVKWDNQNDWEEPNSKQVNLDSSTTPGDIQIKEATQTVPTFTRASVAYLSDGTEVASGQPRFEDGKFGKGVLIEEGTTNRINPTIFNIYPNAMATRTIQSGGEFDGWYKVVATQAGGAAEYSGTIAYLATNIVEVDEQVSFGVDFYSPSGNIKVVMGGSIPPVDMDFFENYRYGKTWLNDTGADKNMVVYFQNKNLTPGAINETFYYRFYQVEAKPYPTSFVDGTRSAETLTIPTAGVLNPTEGTVSFWYTPLNQPASTITGQFESPPIIQVGNYAQANSWLLWVMGGQLRLYWGAGANDNAAITNNLDWYKLGVPVHFVVRWTEGKTFHAFINGTKYGPFTCQTTLTGIHGNIMALGNYDVSGGGTNAIYDELRIDKVARTDAEIADWYNANAPSTPDEYTTYLSRFDGSLTPEKLPYACWESAPKDVSQASNKASGKAVITQTLNNGQVALYSASSPTSSGTYSDWALALPDGTLQHPPDNFVKTKLKLIDTDPYTVLLMHMDGSDNGTTFTDECGKTVTAHGDVCTKTAEKTFGTASAYFDGGENTRLEITGLEAIGTGDFTVDCWIYLTAINKYNSIFEDYNFPILRIDTNNKLTAPNNGLVHPETLTTNTWYHVAIIRHNGYENIYVNGVGATAVENSMNYPATALKIGEVWNNNNGFNFSGYIDELRVSKGIARWTSDFTPPTSQYVLNSKPVVHGLTVTFDGAPSATPILDDMSFGAEYMFTTLKDILVIANGQNAPYKWDGIGTPALLGGSPPVLDFITTHNNRVWGVDAADKSRVRFSDILDPETWSVLNFIDFNPDDGDYITAMVRIGQDLIVSKQWSMALLTGNATTNYSVVWLDAEQGVTGKRALCNTNKYFTYVAQDGIRFTDFNTHAVASERLLPDWEKINKRRLNQAAMVYWRNYLLVALPRDNSLYNNTVWAYDMLRNAWSIINGWNVSNWLIFKQYGEEVLLAADSTTGQIYEVMRYSRYDDTEPVAYSVRTKDFTFNAPERYKLFRSINLDLEATTVESPLTIDLIVDGEKVGEYSTIIPADDQAKIHRMILPPLYNAVIGRSLSLALRGRCGIQGIVLTYSFGGIVPDEEV